MPLNQFMLLINESLKKYLVTMPDKERTKVREKFEYLANGIWDSGARVKKLKGAPGKLVFEARLTKAERILFTLGRRGDSALVYVWAIAAHDDIGRKARSVMPENAAFLRFEEESFEEKEELSIESLPRHYFTQESIEEKATGDYGPQKWLVLTDNEWTRILKKPDPENFEMHLYLTKEQAELLATPPPVLLSGTAGSGKTTLSVYYLARPEHRDSKRLFLTQSALLKEFSANIYNGLVCKTEIEAEANPPRFLTFIELLLEIAARGGKNADPARIAGLKEFESIFNNHKLSAQFDAELVWEEIRGIIKGAKTQLSVRRFEILVSEFMARSLGKKAFSELMDYLCDLESFGLVKKIESICAKKTRFRSYEDFLLHLEESYDKRDEGASFLLAAILEHVRRHVNDFTSPLLSQSEYLALGKKRAPHFIYDRNEIYSLAEYYQSKLEASGMYDEIDLTRKCIDILDLGVGGFSYDLVVCDEAQDFSDVQMSLIFRLCDETRGIVFAGDPKQIINPSGFRWEEVRKKFYERGISVPEVKNLSLNFRCVGNIVRLSNSLLDIKHKLVGITGAELKEDWKFNGKPPLVCYGIEEDALLDEISAGAAGRVVIVRSSEERDRLKKRLLTELVFTINDAKGLEFDTVLLWKFICGRDSRDLWRKIANGEHLDERRAPHVKHEINLLYVAVTRARNTLVIYDGAKPSDIWRHELLSGHVCVEREKSLLKNILARVSLPGEWEKQGDYFAAREYHAAAYECYRNAGNTEKAGLSFAFVLEGRGSFRDAAMLFEKHGNRKKAAGNYERACDFERAAVLWLEAGDSIRAAHCRIRVLEKRGDWVNAGDEWKKLNEDDNAATAWKKGGAFEKLGEYQKSMKQYEEASISFEKAKSFAKAAECAAKAKKNDRAADLYFQAGLYMEAAKLYKRLKKRDRLITCYTKLEWHAEIGGIFEKEKEYGEAIRHYAISAGQSKDKADALKKEAKLLEKGKKNISAALRYAATGNHQKAGNLLMAKKLYQLAASELVQAGDHERLVRLYSLQGLHYESALELEKTDLQDKWDRIEFSLNEYITDGRRAGNYNKARADRIFDEAKKLEQSGRKRNALARYKALYYAEGVSTTCAALQCDDEAMQFFFKTRWHKEALKYITDREKPSLSRRTLNMIIGSLDYYYDSKSHPGRESFANICRIVKSCLDKTGDELTLSDLHDSLEKSYIEYGDLPNLPDEFFELFIRAKCYKKIVYVLRPSKYSAVNEGAERLCAAIKHKGEAERDDNLLLCYYYAKDYGKFEELCATIPITDENYALLGQSKKNYQRIIEYFASKSEFLSAGRLAAENRKYEQAAEFYIKGKAYSIAGEMYEIMGQYEKSIECHKIGGDLPSIAKIHEKRKEYTKALSIWKELNSRKDIRRIENKISRAVDETQQELLF